MVIRQKTKFFTNSLKVKKNETKKKFQFFFRAKIRQNELRWRIYSVWNSDHHSRRNQTRSSDVWTDNVASRNDQGTKGKIVFQPSKLLTISTISTIWFSIIFGRFISSTFILVLVVVSHGNCIFSLECIFSDFATKNYLF